MPKICNKFYLRYFWNDGVNLRLWILDTQTGVWTRTELLWLTGTKSPDVPRSRFWIRKYWFPASMDFPASTGDKDVEPIQMDQAQPGVPA